MKTFWKLPTTLLLATPLLTATVVFALPYPSRVTPNEDDEFPTRASYDYSEPFLRYMPPLSEGDELIGPSNEFEKKHSEGILERLNTGEYRRTSNFNDTYFDHVAQKTLGPSTTLLGNATTSAGLSIPSGSKLGDDEGTVQDLYNATQIVITDSSVDYNTSVLHQTTTNGSNNTAKTVSPLVTDNSSSLDASNTSNPSTVLSSSSNLPKMPKTTTTTNTLSSTTIIPSFKYHEYSPTENATQSAPPPNHRRASRHPILFLLLPFLIAAGVALLILVGSYLRKKIRFVNYHVYLF